MQVRLRDYKAYLSSLPPVLRQYKSCLCRLRHGSFTMGPAPAPKILEIQWRETGELGLRIRQNYNNKYEALFRKTSNHQNLIKDTGDGGKGVYAKSLHPID